MAKNVERMYQRREPRFPSGAPGPRGYRTRVPIRLARISLIQGKGRNDPRL